MVSKKINILLFTLLIINNLSFSQDAETLISKYLHLSDVTEENPVQIEEFNDQLTRLFENPVRINSNDEQELKRLFFLTEFQIKSLISYRRHYGNFFSIYELVYVFGFNQETVELLKPLIVFDENFSRQKITYVRKQPSDLIIRTQYRLQESKGFNTPSDSLLNINPDYNYYKGNRLKTYYRYEFEPNRHVNVMLKGEKDSGEEFFKGSNKQGFDFNSGYIAISDIKFVNQLIIGDYQVNTGQGITFSSNSFYSFGNTGHLSASGSNLKPYRSVNENMFLRGVSSEIKMGDFSFTTFASQKHIDANLNDTLSEGKISFSSIQNTGIHATTSEINNEKSVKENIYGSYLRLSKNFFQIGLSAIQINYDKPYVNNNYNPKFKLNERQLLTGLDYKFYLSKAMLFGEISNQLNKYSYIGGMEIHPNSAISFTFAYRDFNNYLRIPYVSTNLPSGNHPQRGVYMGSEINIRQGFQFSFYRDYYKLKTSAYNEIIPQYYIRNQLNISYNTDSKLFIQLRFKNKETIDNISNPEETVNEYYKIRTNTYRLLSHYYFTPNIRYKVELSEKHFKENDKTFKGFYIGNHLHYTSANDVFSFKIGQFIFEADEYETRHYAYEPDVLYAFSSLLMYKRGVRYYALSSFSFGQSVKLWIKYGITTYPYEETISSGLNEIIGNTVSDFKIQIRVKF